MNLEKNRNFNFEKKKININHPSANFFKISFYAKDNSKIEADLMVPKGEVSNIIVEFPEYGVLNKNYLDLSRYSLIKTAIVSVHIRAQTGNSENNTSCSHFPFLDSYSEKIYYKEVFQDALDIIKICEKIFENKDIYVCGVGQGAAISIVCATFYTSIKKLFIADCSLCYLEEIYNSNMDIGFYNNIRVFSQEQPDKKEKLITVLNTIDIKNFALNVTQKVYYSLSHLDPKTPLSLQKKLISLLKNVEVKNYKRLEYKKIFQHSFDDFILKALSEENN